MTTETITRTIKYNTGSTVLLTTGQFASLIHSKLRGSTIKSSKTQKVNIGSKTRKKKYKNASITDEKMLEKKDQV